MEKRPKHKYAILFGYSGEGYQGLQYNHDLNTIEKEIFSVLVELNAISEMNGKDPKKFSLRRASRTDKGVHALGNLLSLKMYSMDTSITKDKINAKLPDTIRIWDIKRTVKSFDARMRCVERIYEFSVPSSCFLPPRPSSTLANTIRTNIEQFPNQSHDRFEQGLNFWKDIGDKFKSDGYSEEEIVNLMNQLDLQRSRQFIENFTNHRNIENFDQIEDTDQLVKLKTVENESKKNFRISQEMLQNIKDTFKLYEGTNNFHNFADGVKHTDGVTSYIRKTSIEEPIIYNGSEWLRFIIHGQSFKRHQIRRMIALIIYVIRTGCSGDKIKNALSSKEIQIPLMPASGLILRECDFTSANTKLVQFGYEPLLFNKYSKEIEKLRDEVLYPSIMSPDLKDLPSLLYLDFIDQVSDLSCLIENQSCSHQWA